MYLYAQKSSVVARIWQQWSTMLAPPELSKDLDPVGSWRPLSVKIFLILFSEIKTEPLLHLILLGWYEISREPKSLHTHFYGRMLQIT